MNITDQPVILYLNQPYIDQQMQLANEGMVSEIVEEYGETDSTTTSGGLKIYNILNFMKEKSSEETENIAKSIQSTPIGRFAAYHGLIDDSGELITTSSGDQIDLSQIQDGGFVSVKGRIAKSPINDMDSILDRFGMTIPELFEESTDGDIEPDDFMTDEQLGSEFEKATDSFYVGMKNRDGMFYFELNPGYFEDVSTDFPDNYTEYTIFAEVDHCFERGEKEFVVDLMNLIPQKGREEQVKLRRIWSGFADALNEFPGRNFSSDDFYLSSPDIRVTPIAIYK